MFSALNTNYRHSFKSNTFTLFLYDKASNSSVACSVIRIFLKQAFFQEPVPLIKLYYTAPCRHQGDMPQKSEFDYD